eukprot:TRINITY_DN31934_c0_g1_i1.p1 TRINITY_DN31934_c0_g1~~TRINITY_DN31934_c0_g1_i1.p1  ORF type:complete len:474 (-),score=14.39 TRINITY_DN31934_c0_g1_i1:390-1811(-)
MDGQSLFLCSIVDVLRFLPCSPGVVELSSTSTEFRKLILSEVPRVIVERRRSTRLPDCQDGFPTHLSASDYWRQLCIVDRWLRLQPAHAWAARLSSSAHTIVAPIDGSTPLAWGCNSSGQLGLGGSSFDSCKAPTCMLGPLPPVRLVAAGSFHSALISDAGELWLCGLGDHGQLSHGQDQRRLRNPVMQPVSFGMGVRVQSVALGHFFTIVLDTVGHVYCFGANASGQLAQGDCIEKHGISKVTRISFGGHPIASVAAGEEHAVACTIDGHLYRWGKLDFHGNSTLQVPVHTTPVLVDMPRKHAAIQAACGTDNVLVVSHSGSLLSFGYNFFGSLGHGDRQNREELAIVRTASGATWVAACEYHSMFINDHGEVFGFGSNVYGQLGVGHYETVLSPTSVSLPAPAVAVACGRDHTLFVVKDGTLWAVGLGSKPGGTLGEMPSSVLTDPNSHGVRVRDGETLCVPGLIPGISLC